MSSLQLALESHHTPAQAVSNTYHLQLGLGRWGAHSTYGPAEKSSFTAGWQMGVGCLQSLSPLACLKNDSTVPLWRATFSHPPLASGASAISPDSNSRLQKSLSSHSSSLEQRGKLSWKVSKAGPALALPRSPHLTSLWYMRLGGTQASQGSNSSGTCNLTQFKGTQVMLTKPVCKDVIPGFTKKPTIGIILNFMRNRTKIQENTVEYDHETTSS